mmetsp:Transcript_16560/g.28175  ORF Transcript_16560/g.28175 Transcript_16560/m.28175 type:complete len:171 (+) Transcript_16560:521-1033(+)
MQPRKDYQDYSKFINDVFSDDKVDLLNHSVDAEVRKGSITKTHNPIMLLRTQTELKKRGDSGLVPSGFKSAKLHTRNASTAMSGYNKTERVIGMPYYDFDVKPRILESKLAQHQEFVNLSDGFKKIFVHDKKDQKMILPIAGYGGHRRGDRSQNFFGKSFRESSLQSKKL